MTLQDDRQCCYVVGVSVFLSIVCDETAMPCVAKCVCFVKQEASCVLPHFATGGNAVLLVSKCVQKVSAPL